MQTATIATMSEWSEQLVTRIAHTIRDRRKHLGLSVQDVADRASELGHPLSRSTLSDLENGRRKDRLLIGDAVVLAEVLLTTVEALLFPDLPDGVVEYLPNKSMDSWTARCLFHGELSMERGWRLPGVDDISRRSRLVRASESIADLREGVRAARHDYQIATEHGEAELAGEYQKTIQEKEELLEVLKDSVRLLGGVVEDG